ncbi:hypothetical protein CBL_04539 [Carabus blaptoides fortunei]
MSLDEICDLVREGDTLTLRSLSQVERRQRDTVHAWCRQGYRMRPLNHGTGAFKHSLQHKEEQERRCTRRTRIQERVVSEDNIRTGTDTLLLMQLSDDNAVRVNGNISTPYQASKRYGEEWLDDELPSERNGANLLVVDAGDEDES